MATMRPFGFFGGTDPFRELRRIQNEMDQLLGAFAPRGPATAAGGFPAVNIYAGQDVRGGEALGRRLKIR